MKAASPPPRYVETRLGSRFSPGGIALLVLFAATYLLSLVPPVGRWLLSYLVLRPADALGWRPYQLVAGPALMTSIFALLFVGLLLWSIGSAVEQRSGTRRFLLWSASASVVSALAAALAGRFWPAMAYQPVVFDGQPIFMVVLMSFALFYGSMPVRMWGIGEPVSGRGLSYFFVGLGLFADVLRGQWLELVAQAAAVGWMVLVLRDGGISPWQALRRRFRKRSSRGGLEVLSGGRAGRPYAGEPAKPAKKEPRWVN